MRPLIGAAILALCLSSCADDIAPGGKQTLDTCVGSTAAGVPAFYKDFFRCSDISVSGSNVVIRTNNLPPHDTYYYGEDHENFVAFDTSRGAQYKPNPNTLGEVNVTVTIPLNPTARGLTIDSKAVDGVNGSNNNEYKMGSAGIALDGVVLFNPLAAPGDDIEDEKYTFDGYNAHPAGKTYHYHTTSPGPLEVVQKIGLTSSTTPGSASVEIYGIMCDGTVVMGCTEADGSAPKTSDLDSQNGHVHDIKNKDGAVLLKGRYHTHMCPGKIGSHKFTPEIQYYSSCSVSGG